MARKFSLSLIGMKLIVLAAPIFDSSRVTLDDSVKTWMAGPSPAMTIFQLALALHRHARLYAGHPRLRSGFAVKAWMAGHQRVYARLRRAMPGHDGGNANPWKCRLL